MATTQKIEIPVSLSAQIENLREIRQTLTATLNSAGKDSSLAKTLTKDLSKINQMLGQVEDFALSPTIDESGLKQLQKVLDNFYKQVQSSFSNTDFANFEAIASESDIARLKTLTTEAAKYRRELEALQKSGSSERTDAYLLRAGKQDLLGKAQAQKGFDSTASLGKNALAMERAAESYQRSADAMQTAIEKLESEANAAIANAQQAAQQVKTLEQQSQTLGADTQAARFHHAAGRFKTAIVANRGVENPTINSVERGLRSALESVQANGKIATDARNAVGDWIKHLFPQLPTSDIASMVGQDINTLLSDLMERIFGSGYLDADIVYSPEHSAILSRAQDYSRGEINRIANVHSTANVLDLTTRSQQVNSDLRKAKSHWTAYNNEADNKVTSWLEMTDQQEELTAAAQASAQLSQELYTLADAAQKAAIASKEAQIQQNAEAQQDLKEGAIQSTRQLARQGKAVSRQYQAADESFISEVSENLKSAKIDANEAEQFTNNLKQSITHWMSAQQIINLVKDGIRQAYQDIKSLDAAMTNIAVVTDMSVSDLWGKINEYMSIAQQYGVTTQGVYEVSQLYYQQGLSTNEVMAATTETLKMARIAGMGYAEAADAMTVAIRSFKMEMSDAGHVTDVYSKVAAVTASDTEELAIAMSKTASSAESVGSSFENTTAMLAVMVETTRESAQNLGSALKSIISRYGEMKSGMTQDSDGEIIDYNKTDAALRSIGISLKDAQGQFRDFDDVIFELSAKWDSLDKNTQRYIATIMAGNRQQSRFIALVDNWERLDEVANAAQDSEDAGLLQYAKTLDSLDTKLNNLKTSFQSFYMSIFNGEFFKGVVDLANNLVQSFSRLGPLLGSINLLQLINQIKVIGQLIIQSLSGGLSKITKAKTEWQKEFTSGWETVGDKIGDIIANAIQKSAGEGAKRASNAANRNITNSSIQQGQTLIQPTKAQAALSAVASLTQGGTVLSSSMLRPILGTFSAEYKNEAARILNDPNASNADKKWATSIEEAGIKFKQAIIGASEEERRAAQEEYIKEVAAADEAAQKLKQGASQASQELSSWQKIQKWGSTKIGQNIGRGAYAVGTLATSAGMMMDQSTMAGYDWSTGLQALGGAATAAGQFITGDVVGSVITAITTASSVIKRIVDRDKVELENLEKAATEANVERAKAKENASNLEQTIDNLRELEKARYESEEANQAFLDASKAAAEAFPELAQKMDESGQMIIDVSSSATNAEALLYEARKKSADAAIAASAAEAKVNREKANKAKKAYDDYTVQVEDINKGDVTAHGLEYLTGGDFLFSEYFRSEVNNFEEFESNFKNQVGKAYQGLSTTELIGALANDLINPNSNLAKFIQQQEEQGIIQMMYKPGEENYTSALEDVQSWLHEIAVELELITADQDLFELGQQRNKLFKEQNQTAQAAEASDRSVILSAINKYDLEGDPFKQQEWRTFAGAGSIFQEGILNSITEQFGDFSTLITEGQIDANKTASIRQLVVNWQDTMQSFYAANISNLEEIEETYTNALKGNTSVQDAKDYLNDFGKDNPIIQSMIASIEEQDALYRSNLLRGSGVLKDEATFKNYDDWKAETGKDSYDDYLTYAKEQLENNSLADFLVYGSREMVSEYIKINSEIQKAIKSTGNGFGATALQERDKLVKAIYAASMDKNTGFFANIADDAEAYAEFMEIFNTDVGTSEWAEKLEAFVNKHELNWADLNLGTDFTATSAVFENYQIRLQSDIESAIAVNEKVNELFSKQEKGFSWDESQALLKEYQKASEESNVNWANLFEVNEEGAIVLKDISKVLDTLYQDQIEELNNRRIEIGNILTSANGSRNNIERVFSAYNGQNFKNETVAKNMASALNSALGGILTPEQLGQLQSEIQSGAITSYTDLVNFYTNLLGEVDAANEAASKAYNAMLHENYFSEWGKKFEKGQSALNLATTTGSYEDLKDLLAPDAATVTDLNNDPRGAQIAWDEYYDNQFAALSTYGASLDAFGNLIVNDWVAWGEYIADSYGYSEAAIQDAIENDDPDTAAKLSAARAQILQSAKTSQIELQETTLKNIQGGLENLYTSFIEDGEIEFSEVEDILTTLQPKISNDSYAELLQLYEKAKDGTAKDFETFINQLANLARAAGYSINEDEITAKIQDAYTSLVKTLFDSLSNAINGSLTADDLGSLETSLGLDLSAYQQQTLDGYQLSSEGLLKVAGELEHRYGNVAGYAEKMAELFVGEDKLYSGTEELEARIAAIEKAKESEEGISEELEYQLSLLKKMAATSRLNENDPIFNFMDQDSTRGFAAGADQMISSIDKVKSAFSSITAGEQILADDFYNMMDFMYNNRAEGMQNWDDSTWLANALGITPEALNEFKAKTGEAIHTYEDFVNAVVSSSGELGKVDTEVLLEMGISMDTISSSMSASLKEVAQDQIKFLENLRKTLEAYKALEDIGTIEMGTISIGGENVSINLDNFEDYLDKPEFTAKVGEFQQTLLTKLGEKFDVDRAQIANALFGGEFEFSNEEDRTVLQNLKAFFDRIKTFTSQEWQAFILSYPQLFTESGWDLKALSEVISSGLDFSDLLSGISSEAAANINAAIQGKTIANIELGSDNLTYKFTGAKEDWKATEQALQTLYQGQSVTAEFTLEGETVTVHYVNADVKATVDSLKKANFSGLSIDYNGELKQYLGTFTLEGQEINVSVDPSGIKFTGPDGSKIDETMQSAIEAQFTGMGAYNVTSELDENGVLNVTVSDASVDALATINTNVASIVDLLSAGIAISVDSEAANQALVTIQEAYNALKENVANNPIKISLEYDTPPELNLPPITRIVKLEYNNNSSNSSTDGESGAGAAGNFKAVAMTKAKGNVSALLNGAALAQGTLMGELGPELYVQGGQYQIAGANGPEFVDLAPDAIVFNHLQTANLLGKGHTTKTGSPITSERRAVGAYATGNVSGPAMAGGIDSVIAAIDRAISIWKNIANITAADLAGGGGGGGGGDNSVKAVTEELTKWYNLTRQIEKLEQDINNLLAERENIIDGGEYLRSLREEQRLLAQQAATHQTLLAYQEEQLNRQKEHIKNNRIWSQFLTFDEFGNLQYIDGNETNGGQGQLNVLDQLNKMSGEEQLKYIKNTLGYSYTDQDGKTLDGEELITKFFEELQKQIDSYDSLYDTVHSTEEELQKIQTSISEINAEIEKNQMDLEKAIYDIILDSWKKQIEQMEDQKKLTQEANEAYIENLNKALSDERNMYSQNESIADRENLQNRLALLRRSGGSASEIYDLEQQLDDMLKDEYFNKQEEMIQNIEEASKEQIKKLEEQIKLEEEALEYQKENGVLWTQVYEIMRGTEESILAFMQGNSLEFFSQSALQQKQMLTDWAKQIGIYTEDQQYKNYQKEAEDTRWNNGSWRASASEGGVGSELAAVFDSLGADQQSTLQSLFTSTYANKMLETGDENAASAAAIAALQAQLRNIQSQQASAAAASSSGGGNDSGGTGQNPGSDQKPNRYRVDYNGHLTHASTGEIKKVSGYGLGDSAYEAQRAAEAWAKKKVTGPWYWQVAPTYSKPKAFAKGGLVDYTGPALVHGSPSKPEAFLSAKQTAMISEAVKAVGDGGALNGIKATLAALNSTIKGIVNNDNSLTSSFTIAPGAVTIQVAQLNDSYDVEELSKDVMNRMVAIASRATNRGVNRR